MPTYRNDSDDKAVYYDLNGNLQMAEPGVEIQTNQVLRDTAWTKTAYTPYYNPVAASQMVTVTAAGTETVEIVEGTIKIMITSVLGSGVTPYIDSVDNVPALHPALTEGDVLTVDVYNNISELVLVFVGAGSCSVKQLSE